MEFKYGNRVGSGDMLHDWKENPESSSSDRPLAVMVFIDRPFLTLISQSWNMAVAWPKMKSTVPLMRHPR